MKAEVTTFEYMWTIFAPGSLVLAKPFLKQNQIFKVSLTPIPNYVRDLPAKLYITAYCWDWNGKKEVKIHYDFAIERFRGTKDINQLDCYPIKYHTDSSGVNQEAELRKTISERGKKYRSFVQCKEGAEQMHIHKGLAVSEQRNALRLEGEEENRFGNDEDQEKNRLAESKRKAIEVNGKFLIDPAAFLQYGGGGYALGDLDPWTVDEDVDPEDSPKGTEDEATKAASEDESFLLYPPRFLGYSTQEKTWAQFQVDNTKKPPEANGSTFKNKLQLEDKYKTMIEALVSNHTQRSKKKAVEQNEVRDIVKDKGQGLVLLLHGPPGVGKTLTAETIAEATNKPLFIVSVAEIGLNASKAERNLEQLFQLAGRWEAILLV